MCVYRPPLTWHSAPSTTSNYDAYIANVLKILDSSTSSNTERADHTLQETHTSDSTPKTTPHHHHNTHSNNNNNRVVKPATRRSTCESCRKLKVKCALARLVSHARSASRKDALVFSSQELYTLPRPEEPEKSSTDCTNMRIPGY
jgi:hypothetical protein